MFELGFKNDGTGVGKARVEPSAIVEGFDVAEDGGARLGEGSEALVVNHFVFEAAPEGFDEGVVVTVAFAAHGSDEAMLDENLPVSGTGKLHPAIGVDDERTCGPALEQRHAQGGKDEARIEDLVHGESRSRGGCRHPGRRRDRASPGQSGYRLHQ